MLQISGGHKYLPPRRDINAPDMYIPLMALWTYCILIGIALFSDETFQPEIVYNTISSAVAAWALHTFILKLILWVLGIPGSVPLLELVAYAGYAFTAACFSLLAHLFLGKLGFCPALSLQVPLAAEYYLLSIIFEIL